MPVYDLSIINNTGLWTRKKVNGDEIMDLYPYLNARDLYILDENKNFKISQMVMKKHMIIIKIDFVHCIIKQNTACFFNSANPQHSRRLQGIMNALDKALDADADAEGDMIFEIRILETILDEMVKYFDGLKENIRPSINKIINIISNNLDAGEERIPTDYATPKIQLIGLEFKINDIKELFDGIIDEDDDVKYTRFVGNDAFEEMIRDYQKHFEDDVDDIKQMKGSTDVVIEMTNIALATKRNQIARNNILLTKFLVGVSIANLITSCFGMNIINHLEDYNYAFLGLSISLILVIATIHIGLVRFFRE